MARAAIAIAATTPARRGPHASSRTANGFIRAVVLLVLCVAVQQALTFLAVAFARAAFPFDDNIWSDQPLVLQLWRFANGGPLYRPIGLIDSYDYGPLYLLALSTIRAVLQAPSSLVVFRAISVTVGLASVIPLSLFALRTAQRSGIGRERRLPSAIVVIATVAFSLATITRSGTFDALHPDALVLLLLGVALWIYGDLVNGRLSARTHPWLLMAVCLAALLTKLNTGTFFPFLVLGLLAARTIDRRLATLLCFAYAVCTLALLFALPHDMEVWTVLGPLRQPYQLGRAGELVQAMFVEHCYYGGIVLAGVISILGLRRFERTAVDARNKARRFAFLRESSVDGVVVAATAIASFAAFLKRGGGSSDFMIVAFACVPFLAVFLARLWEPLGFRRTASALQCGVFGAVLFTIVGFAAPGRPAPDALDYREMRAVSQEAAAICAGKVTTIVTVFPSLFFGCTNVEYALIVSWGEVRNSFWDPKYLPTILDADPGVQQIVWISYGPLTAVPWHPWLASKYRLIARMPAPFGYGGEAYDPKATFDVYRRIEKRNFVITPRLDPSLRGGV